MSERISMLPRDPKTITDCRICGRKIPRHTPDHVCWWCQTAIDFQKEQDAIELAAELAKSTNTSD